MSITVSYIRDSTTEEPHRSMSKFVVFSAWTTVEDGGQSDTLIQAGRVPLETVVRLTCNYKA